MGYPGKCKKNYDTPAHPWVAQRISDEAVLVRDYGLRNKREVWKAESKLRTYRREARRLLAESYTGQLSGHTEHELQSFLSSLKRRGILKGDADLDHVLSLGIKDLLERRLQTQVCRQGLARTMKQSRQFIVHGHIMVNGRKITVPSYLVDQKTENLLEYYVGSPLTGDHPVKPTINIEG